jgi:WD40 repeat protein
MNTYRLSVFLYALFCGVSALATESQPLLLPQGEQFDNINALLANIMPRKPVLAVDFSPDGQILASSFDDTVYLWDIPSGRELKRLKGESDEVVNAVAFSADGKILAAGASDDSVYIWHIQSGKQLKRLAGHSDDVMAVAFSPDSKMLASSAVDGTVYLWDMSWDMSLWQVVKRLDGHLASANTVAFSPDGKYLASGGSDSIVYVWEVPSGKKVQGLEGHTDSVNAVTFSPDGKTLASASWDKTVRLWNVQSGQEIQHVEGHTHNVNTVAFSPNGKTLVSGSMDTTLRLWDLQLGQQIKYLSGHANNVTAVVFSPSGKLLASGSWDKTVRLWDVQANQEVQRFEGHSSAVNTIAFSPDNNTLAAGSDEHGVILWPTSSGQAMRRLAENYRHIKTIAFSPDGNLLALGAAEDKSIHLLDAQSGQKLKQLEGHSEEINVIAFSPNGQLLAAGSRYPSRSDLPYPTVRLWDLSPSNQNVAKEIKGLYGHSNHVYALAFSPDGKTLASGSDDHTIRLWNLQSAQEIKQLTGHSHFVTAVAFSPDGQRLASSSWDKTVRLWDVQSGEEIKHLVGHSNHVTTVAFSPDGQMLASGSRDKTVRFWDIALAQEIKQLAGHAQVVSAVAFSIDGKTLASSSTDSTVRLWDLKTGELQQVMIGGARETWVSCVMPTLRCWRVDDGTLLVNKQLGGHIQPVLPDSLYVTGVEPLGGADEQLIVESSPASLELAYDKPLPFTLTIHNKGAAPIYWLNVAHTDKQNHPLVFYPPKTHLVLEPNKSTTLPVKVSAWAKYEKPQSQDTTLALSITRANADPIALSIPVRTHTPVLTLQKASLVTENNQTALVITINNQGRQALAKTEFTARIDNQWLDNRVIRDLIDAEQTVNLSFSLSNDIPQDKFDENTRVFLKAIKIQHPIHEWDFEPQPIELPRFFWYGYVLLSVLLVALGIVLYYLYLYRHPLVQTLSADSQQLLTLPLEQLPKAKQLLQQTRRLGTVLSRIGSELKWLDEAIDFFVSMPNQARCKLLANRLSATPQLTDNKELFDLQLSEAFPLNFPGCIVYFPSADLPAAEIIMRLQRDDINIQKIIVISLEPIQQAALRPYGEDRTNLWVVPDSRELTTLLLSPHPIDVFVRLLANQLSITHLSPYQTGGGVTKDSAFFGRLKILAQILNREPRNYLVIGSRQMGKTSLLKKIERRYQNHPKIDCVYLPVSQGGSRKINEQLADLPADKTGLLLVDEADLFIRDEMANGYPMLSHFRTLSEQGRCYFILAGFWYLHEAVVLDYVSPVKNFGESVTIGALELAACRELATKPMAMLGIHYADDKLVEQIITATGQRANLIATVCNEILQNLANEQRILTQKEVTNALRSQAMNEALGGWTQLTDDEQAVHLDRSVVYATVEQGLFKLSEVIRVLDEHDCIYTTEQLEQSLQRLELAFIIRRDKKQYTYCVPLFRDMLLEQELEAWLEQELKQLQGSTF